MQISHLFSGLNVRKNTDSKAAFMLANRIGGFFYQGISENFSRYQGAYFPVVGPDGNWELMKTIERVGLSGSKPLGCVNHLGHFENNYGDSRERFFMDHSNLIIYEAEAQGSISLVLDCRLVHDFSDKGRSYKITVADETILISYDKYRDDGLSDREYGCHISVRMTGVAGVQKVLQWEKRSYPFDRERNSEPSELYVFDALRFQTIAPTETARLYIGYGCTKEEALANSKRGLDNSDYIKKSLDNYSKSIAQTSLDIRKTEIRAAYVNSLKAMDNFLVEIAGLKGMYAGIPWFYQFWSRDEAISTKALVLEERLPVAKNILMRLIDDILPDGRIKNRHPHSELGSADGVGWAFSRIHDLLDSLDKKDVFKDFMAKDDLEKIEKSLKKSIMLQLRNHSSHGLISNKNLETWMDTGLDDQRQGERIEIQTLMLSLYRLMRFICLVTNHRDRYDAYSDLEETTAARIRQDFWHEPVLYDGIDDGTIRPNIFLAYYLYPDLLGKNEWKKAFDAALDKLWLSWGGISTIDRDSPHFHADYTGQDNRSYHNGDSWFWINCLAAICMMRLDAEAYRDKVAAILTASTDEILYHGVIGHHAEVSSASKMTSSGCLAQAWSSALFIELVHEIYGKR